MRDKIAKGRPNGGGGPYGEANPHAKLTREQVIEMRKFHEEGMSEKKLTTIFPVKKSTVHDIVSYKKWKNA